MTAVKVYDGDRFALDGYFEDQYLITVKVAEFLGGSIVGTDGATYPMTPEHDDNFYAVWSVTIP